MKGPLAVGNAWHWHLLFDQLPLSLPLSLPTATGGSDALLTASRQHPRSIPEIAWYWASTSLSASLPSLQALSCAGPSQSPREEEAC